MKSFEPVFKELEYLLIKKLPEKIEKINQEHNDGIILEPFENKSLEENCLKQPCFQLKFTSGEYSEKDRIIENEVYKISIEIKIHSNTQNKIIILWRYLEAIQLIFNEENSVYLYRIENMQGGKVYIRIEATVQNFIKIDDILQNENNDYGKRYGF